MISLIINSSKKPSFNRSTSILKLSIGAILLIVFKRYLFKIFKTFHKENYIQHPHSAEDVYSNPHRQTSFKAGAYKFTPRNRNALSS